MHVFQEAGELRTRLAVLEKDNAELTAQNIHVSCMRVCMYVCVHVCLCACDDSAEFAARYPCVVYVVYMCVYVYEFY